MTTAFRWILRIFVGLAVLGGVAAGIVYLFAVRSVPDYNARWRVEGISGPVEIVRDNNNVPHIFAETDSDVFFGLGFAHAQDRLWQMTMLRRTVQGRLSEVFGARTVPIDDLLRRFDLYGAAERSVAAQSPEARAALEAYAAGVNAWIAQVNARALGRGAPEFFLFSREIAPWRPADSLAVIKAMALQLSSHIEEEVLRARLSSALSPERLVDILPDAPGSGVVEMPEYAALFPGLPADSRRHAVVRDPLDPRRGRGFATASNVFAAAPSRSAAGGTLFANDPHLGLSAPSIWYLARLELSTGGVIGGTIPGLPAVLSGRSEVLGWGLSTTGLDDQDIFIERLNADDPQQYLTPDGYRPFRTETTVIRVKDGPDVTARLRWTENGPVLPGDRYNLASVTPPGHVAALSWTALDPADSSFTAAYLLMRAQTIDAALEATLLYRAPAQNLMLADRSRIAMAVIGSIPRRSVAHQTRGRMPSPGWRTENRWQGTLPPENNPRFIDPQSGILGNTNNRITDAPFPNHLTHVWGDTQRIERLKALMGNREVHTRDSFVEAQLDTVSFTARALLPLIARNLWFGDSAAPAGSPEARRQRALEMLAAWNGEMNEHLPEPLIYAAWLRKLMDRLIRDELGPLADAFTHPDPVFIERVFRNVGGAGAWCNVVQSTRTETCEDIARIALDDALVWLSERHGSNMLSWRWGDAHQAHHDHQVLGDVPVLGWFVNIRQSTSGGDHTLMRGQTSGREPTPFANIHAAGYRGVYDFADPDSSLFVISTGQSGHPLSRHYDDLGELWRRGEYVPMSLDPGLARAAAVGVTRLVPAADQRPR